MNEILNSFGNIDSTEKADHILEMPGQEECFGLCLKNYTCKSRLTTECLNSETKDDFQAVLQLSFLVGHHVPLFFKRQISLKYFFLNTNK